MQQPQLDQVMQKLSHLSPEKLNEVDNFIDFIQERDHDRRLRQATMKASEEAFSKVWDNDEDAAYDDL